MSPTSRHILRHQLHGLWPFVGLYFLTLATLAWKAPSFQPPDQSLAKPLSLVLIISWLLHCLILTLLVQRDHPLETRAQWLTHPIRGRSLLAIKALLYGCLIWCPAVIAQAAALRGWGFDASHALLAALAAGCGLLGLSLFVAILAAMTSGIATFLISGLLVLMVWAYTRYLVLGIFIHRWQAELGRDVYHGWQVFALALMTFTALLALIELYRSRRRLRLVGILAMGLLVVAVIIAVWTGGLFWVGPGSHNPPSIQMAEESRPEGLIESPRRLLTRPQLGHRPQGTYYRLLHSQARLDGEKGGRWYLRQVNEAESAGGIVLGLDEALRDLTRRIPQSSFSSLEPPRSGSSPKNEALELRWTADPGTLQQLTGKAVRISGRSVVEERHLRLVGRLKVKENGTLRDGPSSLSIVGVRGTSPVLKLRWREQVVDNTRANCRLWPMVLDSEELAPGHKTLRRVGGSHDFWFSGKVVPTPLPWPKLRVYTYTSFGISDDAPNPATVWVAEDCAMGKRSARLVGQLLHLTQDIPQGD